MPGGDQDSSWATISSPALVKPAVIPVLPRATGRTGSGSAPGVST